RRSLLAAASPGRAHLHPAQPRCRRQGGHRDGGFAGRYAHALVVPGRSRRDGHHPGGDRRDFGLGRAARRRGPQRHGRAEDLAGIAIVLIIAASAGLAAYEAISRLMRPQAVTHLWAVALAALAGFIGNEWVARYRIATGRRIGSAALVADGLHARTDGFTSLAVLLGAGGVALGWRQADPVVGLVITAAILLVLRDAARQVYRRLMDAVDPGLIDRAEETLRDVDGVRGVGAVRMRWIGHALRAEAEIVVDPQLTVVQ